MPRVRIDSPRPATQLQRQLNSPRPSAIDAFRLARRTFREGRRIDMGALARELGVSRVTLYRWVGSRDDLLVEIVWARARKTIDYLDNQMSKTGGERIVAIVYGLIHLTNGDPAMQRWFSEEGELAMKLLTRGDAGFQPRVVDKLHGLLAEEADAQRLVLPVDLNEMAYVLLRLIESYVYLPLITGEEPDARRPEPILRLLLLGGASSSDAPRARRPAARRRPTNGRRP